VEEDNVGREAKFAESPAPKPLRVIDVVVLRGFRGDPVKGGPRQNTENSVCRVHQRPV